MSYKRQEDEKDAIVEQNLLEESNVNQKKAYNWVLIISGSSFICGVIALIIMLAISKSIPDPIPPSSFQPFIFFHFGDPQIGMNPNDTEINDTQRFLAASNQFNNYVSPTDSRPVAFVLIAGDLTNDRTPSQVTNFFSVYNKYGKSKPAYLVPGNHDVNDSASLLQYRNTYSSVTGYNDYYSFVYNNCLFIALDSTTLISNQSALAAEVEAQWSWLENELNSSKSQNAAYKFIIQHYPPFVVSENEPDSYNNFPQDARERYLNLVRTYQVSYLLCGHLHETKVIQPTDNAFTIYVVGGTAMVFDDQGFGYRIFNVDTSGVTQQYIRLPFTSPFNDKAYAPNCPNLYE